MAAVAAVVVAVHPLSFTIKVKLTAVARLDLLCLRAQKNQLQPWNTVRIHHRLKFVTFELKLIVIFKIFTSE